MKILSCAATLLAIAPLVIFTAADTLSCPSCDSVVETVCWIGDVEGRCMSMPDVAEPLCVTGGDLCNSVVADQDFQGLESRSLMTDPLRCFGDECGTPDGYITACIGVVYNATVPGSDNPGFCCQAASNSAA